MKKILLVLLILGNLFIAFPVDVDASDKLFALDTGIKCSDSFLGTTEAKKMPGSKYYYPAYYLQMALNIIKYVGVIICIALSVVDFFKEIMSEDKEGYKKVVNQSIKRLVFAIVIFILPNIVMQLLKLVGVVANATCRIV